MNVIDKLHVFLERSNLASREPEVIRAEIDEHGRMHSTHSSVAFSQVNNLRGQDEISLILVFTVLDAMIDIAHPHLEGESFAARYRQLSGTTDKDLVFKETYRFFKLLRNAVTHKRSVLNFASPTLAFSYVNKQGTSFELECASDAVIYGNTIVRLMLEHRASGGKYLDNQLLAYYRLMRDAIMTIKDEFGSGLAAASAGINMKPLRRYRVQLERLQTHPVPGYVLPRWVPNKLEAGWACDEFVLDKGGAKYLVPGEALGEDQFISVAALEVWKVLG